MERLQSSLSKIIDTLEEDNRGVQWGCYSIALIGLTVAVKRVKPLSRFKRASDVPAHFIRERRELRGIVERIEPNGALLMVNHTPLLKIPGLPKQELPVKISGIKVSGLGINWLQAIVVGNEVKFIPVAKDRDFLRCEVLLPQKNRKKAVDVSLGETLAKIGFGSVHHEEKNLKFPLEHRLHLNYYKRLKIAEDYATRKQLGYKYYVKQTKVAVQATFSTLNSLAQRLYSGTMRKLQNSQLQKTNA